MQRKKSPTGKLFFGDGWLLFEKPSSAQLGGERFENVGGGAAWEATGSHREPLALYRTDTPLMLPLVGRLPETEW